MTDYDHAADDGHADDDADDADDADAADAGKSDADADADADTADADDDGSPSVSQVLLFDPRCSDPSICTTGDPVA